MTTVAAVVFMVTSLGLSLISTKSEVKSILETGKQQQTTKTDDKKPVAPVKSGPSKTPEQIRQEVEELSKKNRQTAPAPAPAQQQNSGSNAAQPEKPAK